MSIIDELEDEEDGAGWIATFADMVTLLLVFFILLYSLSELDVGRFQRVIASIQNSLRGDMAVQLGLTEFLPPSPPVIIIKQTPNKPDDKDKTKDKADNTAKKSHEEQVFDDLKDFIKNHKMESVGVKLAGKKIGVRVKDRGLFAAGKASLKDEAKKTFAQINEVFLRYPEFNISIKGHTDNVPIRTLQFPSNWELSAIRATSVLRFFLNQGVRPERLTATGYADILPLVPNSSKANKALNRRVEFVLEKAF